mmetsp:Transcript_17590/g.39738  ORF Transcript_17590/g.39738 Transcript_17590/m.39738 type:complete len:236 (+) Transcript_17590:1084-1791(+)
MTFLPARRLPADGSMVNLPSSLPPFFSTQLHVTGVGLCIDRYIFVERPISTLPRSNSALDSSSSGTHTLAVSTILSVGEPAFSSGSMQLLGPTAWLARAKNFTTKSSVLPSSIFTTFSGSMEKPAEEKCFLSNTQLRRPTREALVILKIFLRVWPAMMFPKSHTKCPATMEEMAATALAGSMGGRFARWYASTIRCISTSSSAWGRPLVDEATDAPPAALIISTSISGKGGGRGR